MYWGHNRHADKLSVRGSLKVDGRKGKEINTTTWEAGQQRRTTKDRTTHGYVRPSGIGENGSGSVDRPAQRGGEWEEDICPETLEAVLNHSFLRPTPETNE